MKYHIATTIEGDKVLIFVVSEQEVQDSKINAYYVSHIESLDEPKIYLVVSNFNPYFTHEEFETRARKVHDFAARNHLPSALEIIFFSIPELAQLKEEKFFYGKCAFYEGVYFLFLIEGQKELIDSLKELGLVDQGTKISDLQTLGKCQPSLN